MNRTAPEGGQELLKSLKGIAAMTLETPAQRYRREAAECELNAEKATNGADRQAWQHLSEDWIKLARGAEVNPRLSASTAQESNLSASTAQESN